MELLDKLMQLYICVAPLVFHCQLARTFLLMLDATEVVVFLDQCEPAGRIWVQLFWPVFWFLHLVGANIFTDGLFD